MAAQSGADDDGAGIHHAHPAVPGAAGDGRRADRGNPVRHRAAAQRAAHAGEFRRLAAARLRMVAPDRLFWQLNIREHSMESKLFTPFSIGDMALANRITIAPMCQYSAIDGSMTEWHLMHLGTLALSGASMLV